jgi:hypothetical protein
METFTWLDLDFIELGCDHFIVHQWFATDHPIPQLFDIPCPPPASSGCTCSLTAIWRPVRIYRKVIQLATVVRWHKSDSHRGGVVAESFIADQIRIAL